MATRIVRFFATKEDLITILPGVEQQRSLKYVLTGLLYTAALQTFESATQLPLLGTATHESAICGSSYLVAGRNENIMIYERPQNAGGIRYEVSQLGNPGTITFQPGGLFEGVLLYGRVATISDDPASLVLYRLYSGAIRKHFKKFEGDYIGPRAELLWDAGTRLAEAVQAPHEADLRR